MLAGSRLGLLKKIRLTTTQVRQALGTGTAFKSGGLWLWQMHQWCIWWTMLNTFPKACWKWDA